MPFASRRRDLAALAALTLTITFLFADVLFLGNNFYVRDLSLQYYPIRRTLHDLVAAGQFPFWNPRVSGGQPLAANPAYETFYPFQWLLFLPDFDLGFRWTIVLHFTIAAFGMYALLRALRARFAAALFGAITFTLGGMFLSLTNLLPFLFSAAWLPWIGLFWHRALEGRRRTDVALTALALGMLLLAADQSMILQACGLIAAYAFYYAIRRGGGIRVTTVTAVVFGFAVLAGSAQLFPALDLQADSTRSLPIPYPVASSWSLGPQRPLEMLFPNLDAWYSKGLTLVWSKRSHPEFPLPLIFNYYPGLLAGVLIVAGFIRRIRGWPFVAGWALFSYLLALGRNGPLFRIAYDLGIRSIRYPEKFFVSAVFVLTIFAALAADELDRNAALRRTALAICAAMTIISIALYAWAHTASYERLFAAVWSESNPLFITASRRGWLLSAATSALLCALFAVQMRIGARAGGLFAMFVLLDLGLRMGGLAPRIERGYYDPPPAARDLAAQSRPVRIYNDAAWSRRNARLPLVPLPARLWATRNGMIPRMQEIWGFGGMFEEDLDLTTLLPTHELSRIFRDLYRQRQERVPLLLALAAVTDVGSLQIPNPEFKTDEEVRRYSYVRFLSFPGNRRYWFADALIPIRGANDAERILASDTAISRHSALVDFPPFPLHAGTIVAAREEPAHLALEVACAGPAFLVIAITPHKYWRATLDGRTVTLQRANIGFQGMAVPAGRHHVELIYRNDRLIAWGIVSIISILTLLTIAVGGALRSRAPRPPWPH